jgi:hypothetical protein
MLRSSTEVCAFSKIVSVLSAVHTCNVDQLQVMEIMLVYLETSDWGAALEKVIPARKRGGGSDKAEEGAGGDVKRAKTTQISHGMTTQ